MRRISMLSALIAAALAIAALAASSASAYTPGAFCKSAPASHECGGSAFPVGTEIKSSLHESLKWETAEHETVLQCSGSTLNLAVTEWSSAPATTALTFSGCTRQTTSYPSTSYLYWNEGTDNGLLTNYSQVTINIAGLKCTYAFAGFGEVIGGSEPKIKYNHASFPKIAGGFLCFTNLYVTGQYDISTPTPLYVEKE